MASRARYVGGDCNKIAMKPSPSYPFEKGDLLYMHPADNTLRPAKDLTNNGTEGNTQLAFAEYFVGVADEKYGLQSGEVTFNLNQMLSAVVSVCTTGRFEFDCPSQTWAPNAPVGIYSVSGSAIADSQKVDALASPAALAQMIGIVAQTEGQATSPTLRTRVVVDIMARRPFGSTPVAGTYSGTSGQ
jgi:hypothetical protein